MTCAFISKLIILLGHFKDFLSNMESEYIDALWHMKDHWLNQGQMLKCVLT